MANPWDVYMDTLDGYTNKQLKFGGLFGTDGSRWTSKGDFNPSAAEVSSVINICNNVEVDTTKAQTGGLYLGGTKYKYLRQDPEDKSVDFSHSCGGKLHIGNAMVTKTGVVVCIIETPSKSPAAKTGCNQMACYLKDCGY